MQLEEKVEQLYKNIYFKKVMTKKFITILKLIVIDKEKNIGIIANKANTTEETVKKYINSKELILGFLTEEEYNEFLTYIDALNKRKEEEKYELYNNVITDILESRLKVEDICIKNYITSHTFKKIFEDKEYLIKHFGDDIINKLNFRISETKVIRTAVPRDKYFIEEAWDLKIVKDKIRYLGNYDYKLLRIVSNYILSGANLNFVANKFEISIPTIYTHITDHRLKEIIKEEYYNLLQEYMKYENILNSADFNIKREFILELANNLKNCNYNLEKINEKLKIPRGIVERIINDDLLKLICSEKDLQILREKFNSETDQKTRKK